MIRPRFPGHVRNRFHNAGVDGGSVRRSMRTGLELTDVSEALEVNFVQERYPLNTDAKAEAEDHEKAEEFGETRQCR